MIRWTLPLAVATLMLLAPTAQAGFADAYLPVFDAARGVSTTTAPGTVVLRLGPKAAKLHRTLAGKKAAVGCGDPTAKRTRLTGFTTETGSPTIFTGGGFSWAEQTLSRRGAIKIPLTGDVCFVATKEGRTEECMPLGDGSRCVRALVGTSDVGRVKLDEFARTLELDVVFSQPIDEVRENAGANAVLTLPTPDAPTSPGHVGLFDDGHTRVAAVNLADGRRLYVSQVGDVFSTNVRLLAGPVEIDSLL